MTNDEDSGDNAEFPAAERGPTVLRIALGSRLRQLRDGCGISREAAGDAIRGSHAKISRLELGRTGFKERDLHDLLNLYGVVEPAERETYFELARRANDRGGGSTTAICSRRGSRPTSASNRPPPRSAPTRRSSSPGCCRPPITHGR
ncbi:helix-turn-helix domain-containing protein [Nocardia sp. NPDC051929]|uniref:helix-turn-helix domain-containing protein n=1 Tax=Nocardia sp. NPDC051929 TaxID=3364327 RepID=UPI0037C9CCC0